MCGSTIRTVVRMQISVIYSYNSLIISNMKKVIKKVYRIILDDESDIFTLLWVGFWFVALFAYHLFK